MLPRYPSWLAALLPKGAPPSPPPPPIVVNPFPVDLVAYLGQSLPEVNLYPCQLPEKGTVFPALTFNLVHTGRFSRLVGSSGVAIDRYQFDVWSEDLLDATVTGEQLRTALQGFQGLMGTTPVAQAHLLGTMTGYEQPVDASDTGKFRVMLEFTITRQESISRPGSN